MRIYKEYTDWITRINSKGELIMYHLGINKCTCSKKFNRDKINEKFKNYDYDKYDDWIHNPYRVRNPIHIPEEQIEMYWKKRITKLYNEEKNNVQK